MTQTFLITSATGTQGGSAARELLDKNYKVHAYVRDPTSTASLALQSDGATLFKGDFDDLPAIAAAIKGCTGVFLNTYPSFVDPNGEGKHAQNVINAALEAKTVTTFIASTVLSPTAEEFIEIEGSSPILNYYYKQKLGVETAVYNSGLKYFTVLRPGYLMHNFLAPACMTQFPEYPTEHVMNVSFGPEYRLPFLDGDDVGKFAAAAFVEPEKFHGQSIDLVNDQSLTIEEVAALITKVSGVDVRVKFLTEEETDAIIASGKSPAVSGHKWWKTHPNTSNAKHLEKYGIKLGHFKEFLESKKDVLLDTLGAKSAQ